MVLLYSAFGKSLCTYKRCWKWCPRGSIQTWTRLILFANTFCRSAFGKSLCTYKRCWKWCPRGSIQAWTKCTDRSLSAQRLSERTVSVNLLRTLSWNCINPLNAELNLICHLLALLGGATIVDISRLRVKLLGMDWCLFINITYRFPSFEIPTKTLFLWSTIKDTHTHTHTQNSAIDLQPCKSS
jgi:hypothetical protein